MPVGTRRYTTSQLAVVLQKQTALALIQIRWGFPFHFVHFAATLLENMFFHQMVQFKYAWIHKLCHEVQPLYRLAHLEHHICKGTYPTTPAAGLWEVWIEGGTLFFCNTLACVPYFFFHAAVSGPNIVVHTMWPQKSLVQQLGCRGTMSCSILLLSKYTILIKRTILDSI